MTKFTTESTTESTPKSTVSLPLLIVILNYRTADLTIDCLRSLVPEVPTIPGIRVVVVDNDSQDGSAEKIAAAIATQQWGDWASTLPLDHNSGYASGNNAAVRVALAGDDPPPYVLLLNPDTVIRPGAVRSLLDFMESHATVGIAGSRLENPDGSPQRSTFRFPSIASEFETSVRFGPISKLMEDKIVAPPPPEVACPTDWVCGASIMIRSQVFESVGLMDEGYFLYYEELDFCVQAGRAGWECWHVPESRVVHLEGQSTGVTDLRRRAKRRPQYWFDSRRRYFVKNHGVVYAALADVACIVGHALWTVRRTIQQKPHNDPPQFLNDLIGNSVFLKGRQLADWRNS